MKPGTLMLFRYGSNIVIMVIGVLRSNGESLRVIALRRSTLDGQLDLREWITESGAWVMLRDHA